MSDQLPDLLWPTGLPAETRAALQATISAAKDVAYAAGRKDSDKVSDTDNLPDVDAIYRTGWLAGIAAAVAVCKRYEEIATWSDQTEYYKGKHDAASDCALDISELEPPAVRAPEQPGETEKQQSMKNSDMLQRQLSDAFKSINSLLLTLYASPLPGGIDHVGDPVKVLEYSQTMRAMLDEVDHLANDAGETKK